MEEAEPLKTEVLLDMRCRQIFTFSQRHHFTSRFLNLTATNPSSELATFT
jgi:hypothetical protein